MGRDMVFLPVQVVRRVNADVYLADAEGNIIATIYGRGDVCDEEVAQKLAEMINGFKEAVPS